MNASSLDRSKRTISGHFIEIALENDRTRAFEQKTEQLMEALSDPKRIALLRLSRQRPHFGREVAEQLGVSASTASYHIEKLVTAHLVRLELSSGRRFYYAINPHGFRELLDLLEEQFIGQKKDKETNGIPGNETRKTD